jgi:predicted ATP-grasp superfamily ATP-dependent carboligase
MSSRRRALVFGEFENMVYGVVASLGAAGLDIVVLGPPAIKRLERSRYCSKCEIVPADVMREYGAAFEARMKAAVELHRIDIVIPADYDSTAFLTRHPNGIGAARVFPVPETSLMNRMNCKWEFAKLCASLNIDTPKGGYLATFEDAAGYRDYAQVVVKPPRWGNSWGVYTLESGKHLPQHLLRSDKPGNELPQVVQEYVDGIDRDVTVIADQGHVVAAVIQEHIQNGEGRNYIVDAKALAAVNRIVAATGYRGVLDVGFRFDAMSGRLAAIEANPRFPGTTIAKYFAGANLPLAGVRAAFGEPVGDAVVDAIGTFYPVRLKRLRSMISRAWWARDMRPTHRAWRFLLSDPLYLAGRFFSQKLQYWVV